MKLKSRTTTETDLLSLVTPGDILFEEFMKPMDLTANALSIKLRVPANRIQAIIRNQRGITADTALRLSQYFGNSAQFWMNLQQNYELEKTKREKGAVILHDVERRPLAS